MSVMGKGSTGVLDRSMGWVSAGELCVNLHADKNNKNCNMSFGRSIMYTRTIMYNWTELWIVKKKN